jgi:branched-chain amino acid transport system permease protein
VTLSLVVVQLLNGVQFGLMLFLMGSGLTLVFGMMNFINLAHGSFYMIGAFIASSALTWTGNFPLSLVIAVVGTGVVGVLLELAALSKVYEQTHLQQVLITFGLILVFNEAARMIWGPFPVPLPIPALLAGTLEILPGIPYPAFRLAILLVGLAVATVLYVVISHTRAGMWVRAGASDRPMASAIGVNVQFVFTVLFGIGAALAGLAGVMAGPILTVQVGMGEPILILSLVVTVIGGIGSVRGAFIAALLVGIIDTFGRILFPPAIGSMMIFLLMAIILGYRPQGIVSVRG